MRLSAYETMDKKNFSKLVFQYHLGLGYEWLLGERTTMISGNLP